MKIEGTSKMKVNLRIYFGVSETRKKYDYYSYKRQASKKGKSIQ